MICMSFRPARFHLFQFIRLPTNTRERETCTETSLTVMRTCLFTDLTIASGINLLRKERRDYRAYGATYLRNYVLTYLLTPWSRVLLEKITGYQLVKKFPTFYGSRRFITAITNARHLSLFWARSIQSLPIHSTS